MKHMRTILSAVLSMLLFAAALRAEEKVAVFAGGCFWCMEPPFDKIPGVTGTVSGYTGGHVESPGYDEVSGGATGHREAIRVTYQAPATYEQLLDVFWRNVDPSDGGGQFCDRGFQYTSAIFVSSADERALAERSKAAVQARGITVATEIADLRPFYAAEEYHQDYYRKNPIRYRYYRYSCGRDERLEQVWGVR